MLDRIRGVGDTLAEHIAAKPALYTKMRAVVRSQMLRSDSCRLAIAQTQIIPTKRDAILVYNRCYDLANLGNESALSVLRDVGLVTGIGITLPTGERAGPPKYEPVASLAA